MEENVDAWEMFQDFLVLGPTVLDLPWFRSKTDEEQYLLKEKLKLILQKVREVLPRGGA